MRYSVIIPVYNAESTLCRCVDSLLNQKYSSAEIILINDGSIDRSGEICREYAEKYDRIVYIEQENSGASSARNAGLAVATGSYITFVDSDDYVLDGYFESLDCSDVDLIVFSYRTIRSDGECGYRFSQALMDAGNHIDRILAIQRDRIVGPVNKRFKRSIIADQELRFKTDLIVGEDAVFGLEYMLCCDSSRIIDKALYCVDETGMGSLTRAARYDLSQFTRMYRYMFEIVNDCRWMQKDKERLIQLLDYLYCRTAFARTEHCLLEKKQAWKRAALLIAMFRNDYHLYIRPLSKLHGFMRLCVRYGVVPIFLVVGYAHVFVRKIKKIKSRRILLE